MKKLFLFALLLLGLMPATQAQVPSDCTVPTILREAYSRDVVNLAMTAMYNAGSPDTAFVHVPASWADPIAGGIAAIYNATSLPERDSVFNFYCVHDRTSPLQTYAGYLIQIDTNHAWTQAWQNLTSLTGNAPLDDMLVKYDLEISQYFNWSFGQYALLQSDSLWNNRALIDSLETIQGIIYGEPDQIVGDAGKIHHFTLGNDRYYDFYFEWSDCFDGCDNYRVWHFKVSSDCNVTYLGFDDWGFFGIMPLPAPSNCNISTDVADGIAAPATYKMAPNPTNGLVHITAPEGSDMPAMAELHDLTGRKVLVSESFTDAGSLNLEGLPNGVYALSIWVEGQIRATFKVLKQ